jgi:polysaccharide biosynthesis/export protein
MPVKTRETKPLEKYDARSAKSPAEPSRTEHNSVGPGNSSLAKNVRRAEIASTESTEPNATSASKSADLSGIYEVGPGDVLDIRIISSTPTEKSTLFTVTSHGLVEHPLFGRPLNVLGLTTDEISARIEKELKAKAITESPVVLVAVREYVSHTIIVGGLVKDPGTKILRREAVPLYVILADAQPVAEAECVSVISKGTSEITTIELSDSKSLKLPVRPGDVVNVQVTPKQYFYIGGEVKAPGEKSFRRGLTLTQAILAAGGLSSKAATVQVARESSNGRLSMTRYKLDDINTGKLADPLLQQGDRITVTHR